MQKMESYIIALIQMACQGTREENLERARQRVVDASEHGAGLICLPELFCSIIFASRKILVFSSWPNRFQVIQQIIFRICQRP